MALVSGTVLGGRYRVGDLIARGGMADVWAALDAESGAEVAVKVLHARLARTPASNARFEREAALLGRIQSPYVSRLHGTGRAPDGALYLVFDRLRGETLEARLVREHFLPFFETAPLFDNLLEGLADAHAAGVIHRDLKPANVFVERRADGWERATILDFGVSKLRAEASDGSAEELTSSESMVGSVAYMAPEQIDDPQGADERADVYAAGSILFRALCGRRPFEGGSVQAIMALKLDRDPPTLAEVTHERWPAALERYVRRALARDRGERFGAATLALTAWRNLCQSTDRARKRLADGPRFERASPVVDSEMTRTQTLTSLAARRPRRKTR